MQLEVAGSEEVLTHGGIELDDRNQGGKHWIGDKVALTRTEYDIPEAADGESW